MELEHKFYTIRREKLPKKRVAYHVSRLDECDEKQDWSFTGGLNFQDFLQYLVKRFSDAAPPYTCEFEYDENSNLETAEQQMLNQVTATSNQIALCKSQLLEIIESQVA